MMKIGELSKISNCPTKTIRFYEEIGVLDEPKRDVNGYRIYTEDALRQLQFIKNSQAAGLTLKEITQILSIRKNGDVPCHHVKELLDRHLNEVVGKISQLRKIQVELEKLITHANMFDPADCDEESICKILNN